VKRVSGSSFQLQVSKMWPDTPGPPDRATGYDWQFVPEAGKNFTDSGSGKCDSQKSAVLN